MALPLARKNLVLKAGWRYPSGALHASFDYEANIGTPVFAVRDGRILKTRNDVPNLGVNEEGHTGDPVNFILQVITYKNAPATVLYLHLSPGFTVKAGDDVKAGHQIAHSGHNGHSTGPHFHISVVKGSNPDVFAHIHGFQPDAKAPEGGGLASNGVTFYPPSLVYGRSPVSPFSSGEVVVAELRFGTQDSESVRRLQFRLNRISLDGGAELPLTGDYGDPTRAEVVRWQLQKLGAESGSPEADGNISRDQADRLFGRRYHLV